MELMKRKQSLCGEELIKLMTLREVFRSTNCGDKVCIVTDKERDWEEILGKYYTSLINRVTSGMIYCRILNNTLDELSEDDLSNVCVEII